MCTILGLIVGESRVLIDPKINLLGHPVSTLGLAPHAEDAARRPPIAQPHTPNTRWALASTTPPGLSILLDSPGLQTGRVFYSHLDFDFDRKNTAGSDPACLQLAEALIRKDARYQ